MMAEFKEFLVKTNALALAVGVIIGVALGNVVTSLVNDIINRRSVSSSEASTSAAW